MKKTIFHIVVFAIFLTGGIMGVMALAGVCGVIWGPAVFQEGPPDRSQPWFWIVLILIAPFMLIGFASAIFLIILPLSAFLKIPIVENKTWNKIEKCILFFKRACYEASPKERERDERIRERILKPGPLEYYMYCILIGGLAGKIWSLLFFSIMNIVSTTKKGPTFFEENVLPILGFAIGGVLAGWIFRKSAKKND